MEEAEAIEIALPASWRTLDHLKAQVNSPSCVRQDVPTSEAAAKLPEPTALIILYNFFAQSPTRKRERDVLTPTSAARCAESGEESARRRTRKRDAAAGSCSPVLRRSVDKLLTSVRTAMGNVDPVTTKDALIILHVTLKPTSRGSLPAACASTTLAKPPKEQKSAWHISGFCICECVQRAFRAATSAALCSSPASEKSRLPPTVDAPLAIHRAEPEQVTHIGDVWCSGTVFCGIKLFWVTPRVRGEGVAFALVEAARRLVCYGYEVPSAHVAFSEPTWLGSRFARRYQLRDDFLVY